MNKLTDIAILNKSAKNTATAHMPNRCRALETRNRMKND